MESNHYSRQELLQYLNIDLLLDELRTIEDHVEKCDSCQKVLKELEPESNKEDRDKFFENATLSIRSKQNRKSNPKRKANVFFIGVLIAIISGELWAIHSFDLFPSLSQFIQKSEPLREENYRKTSDEPSANTILVDSLIIESDTLENDNSATNDLGIGLIKEEKVEKTVFPKKNIDGTQQVQSAEIATKPPIETNNEVIIDPVVQAKENTIAKVETYDIQPEKKEQEMPEIVKKGIINVMAASAKQATPEGGFTGLNQYIKNGYTYPDVALQSDLQGEVLVQFSLTTDGRITDLQIVSGLSKECDNIVKNIIQNGPKWQPFVGDDFVEYRSASLKFIFKL